MNGHSTQKTQHGIETEPPVEDYLLTEGHSTQKTQHGIETNR